MKTLDLYALIALVVIFLIAVFLFFYKKEDPNEIKFNPIVRISEEDMKAIIENKKTRGLFYCYSKETESYIACDSLSSLKGEFHIAQFQTELDALNWLEYENI